MTAGIVSPVVPPTIARGKKAARPNARRALPLPHLVSNTARSTVCGLASIDCNGRVAEAAVITVLGWVPGDRLNIREHGGLVRITADRHGVFRMTRPGQLRLPATVRHWCKLTPGSRVLLVADPHRGNLTVYPPAVLDAMITMFNTATLGGDRT